MPPLQPSASSTPRLPSPAAVAAARADLERLGEQIAELSAHIQAATYQLLVMIREFDARDGWGGGFRSCAHWLTWRTGLDLGAAREKVRVARALGELPAISSAMERGAVSYSKVRAMTRVATPGNEAELLRFAKNGTAAHVEKLVRLWRRVDRLEEAAREARRHQERSLQLATDEDGMVVVRGRLDPEVGAALAKALEAAAEKLYRLERDAAGEVSAAQRRADALGLVAESALAGGLDPGTRGDRYQVVVHVEAEALSADGTGVAAVEDAADVSAETSRRLACDAAKVVMRHAADGSVLDVGRRTRAVSPALCRALAHRDGGCRFPGCGLTLCDAHHVEHWADGGPTRLDNLLELCRRHHRAVHEEGFGVELRPDGEAVFRRPDGRILAPAPEPPGGGDRIRALLDHLAARRIEVDPAASRPDWDGGPCDYNWALQWLRSRDPAKGESEPF
jgi:ribosomal protein S5